MKMRLLTVGLAAFLLAGCGSGDSQNDSVTEDVRAEMETAKEDSVPKPADNMKDAVSEAGGTGMLFEAMPVSAGKQLPGEPVGWYMRTVLSTTLPGGKKIEHRTAGVFGELDESSDGLDRHDIEAYGKAEFQVRFINENLKAGVEYFSDYRAYDGNTSTKVWTFLVRNQTGHDLSGAMFRIALEGPYDIYRKDDGRFVEVLSSHHEFRRRFVLEDVDHGTVYRGEELFGMDGRHTRTFRWILADEEWTPSPFPAKLRAAARVKVDEFDAGVKTGSSKFGLPPE